MGSALATAEELYAAMNGLPSSERVRFFTLLGEHAFAKESFTHDEVFGNLSAEEFTAAEAAEYLEVSVSTFRRYVQGKKVTPSRVVGRNQFFSTQDLRSFKRALREVKRH